MSSVAKTWVWALVLGVGLPWLAACQAPAPRPSARSESLVTCSSSADPCDDGELCTQDECLVANNICQNRFIAGCCVSAADCDDDSECTENLCLSNVCTFRAILGCVPSLDSGTSDAGGDSGVSDSGVSDSGVSDPGPRDVGSPDAAVRDAQTHDAESDAASDAHGQLDPALDVRGGACATSPSAGVSSWLWLVGLLLLLILRRRRGSARFTGKVRTALWLLPTIMSLLIPAVTRADGFRLDRYRAPPLPEDLFWLERAAPPLRADGAFSRLSIVYSDDPLVLGPGSPDAGRAIVSEQLALSLSVGFSAWRHLHVSVAMPVWFQRGDPLEATPGLQRPGSPAAGDPVVDLRAVLLGRGAPVELSLALSATIPVGNSAAYAADDGPTFTPRVALGVPFGRLGSFIGLNLGATLRPSARLGALHVGSDLIFALGARFGLTERIAATIELAGSSVLSRAFDPRHTPLEASVGVRYEREAGVMLGTGIGLGLSPGYGAPDLRVLFTAGYRYTQGTSVSGQARRLRDRAESFAASAGTSYGRARSPRTGDHDVGR